MTERSRSVIAATTRVRRMLGGVLLAAALVAPAGAIRSAHAQEAADVSAARELFKKAGEHAKKEEWAEARKLYERSLVLKRTPLTLYSLGIAQIKTGALVSGMENLRAFLVEGSEKQHEAFREKAKQSIAEVEPRIGSLLIEVQPADVPELGVLVDGVAVPAAAFGLARPVDPGEHRVEARAPGFDAATTTIRVEEGGSERVALTLKKSPIVVDKPAPKGPEKPVDEPMSWGIPLGVLGGGVAILGVGIGVGLAGVSKAKDSPTSDGPEADSAKTMSTVGDVLGGVGIAAAAVGVVLVIVRATSGDSEPPAAAPAATADGLVWRF